MEPLLSQKGVALGIWLAREVARLHSENAVLRHLLADKLSGASEAGEDIPALYHGAKEDFLLALEEFDPEIAALVGIHEPE